MSVILFDGVCNLCDGMVRFVIAQDSRARFQFASLGSEAAHKLLSATGEQLPPGDSMVLIENSRIYTRSSAALRVAKGLSFPWPILYVFMLVPRPIRDSIYNFVARNRYRWFGQRDMCAVPAPHLRGRFLA